MALRRILRILTLLVSLWLTCLSVSEASLSIQIIDWSDPVLIYSPTFILGVIQNTGNVDEIVPVNPDMDNGWHVEGTLAGQKFFRANDFVYDRGTDHVVRLRPKENYYFLVNIGERLLHDGICRLQIVYESSGRCIVDSQIAQDLRAQPLGLPGTAPNYKCWEGTRKSQKIRINVLKPDRTDDIEALNYVYSNKENIVKAGKKTEGLDSPSFELSSVYRYLQTEFPTSYYTYASGLYVALASGSRAPLLESILDLQPDHPLRRFCLTEWATSISDSEAPGLSNSSLNRLTDLVDRELSKDLKRYIEQFRREHERLRRLHPTDF